MKNAMILFAIAWIAFLVMVGLSVFESAIDLLLGVYWNNCEFWNRHCIDVA